MSVMSLARAAEGDRDKAVSLYKLTIEAMAKKDYQKAFAYVDEGIRLDPTWDLLHYTRAYLHYHFKHDMDRTISDCDKAIELSRKPFPDVFIVRAQAYRSKRQFEKAEVDLKKALELDPKNIKTRLLLGWVFFDAEQWDKAISEFTEVCKKQPRHYDALAYRGAAYCKKKAFKKAFEDLNEAVRLEPKDYLAFVFRASAHFDNDDDDNAFKDCNHVLRTKPADTTEAAHYARVYCLRGVIYGDKEETEKALADFSEAIRLAPKYARAYLERALILGEENQFAKAVTDLTEFIRLEPNDPQGYEWRAKAYFALGDLKKSVADERKAKELRNKK